MNNKAKSLFISAAILFFAAPVECYSAESSESNFTYTIINDEATIIGFTGEPVYIEIPETLEGCPVTQIRDNAFFCCTSLKQISLPSGIKKIGHHTFYECSSLESVALPSQLEEIGMGAFSGCENLTVINIPDTLEALPELCFEECNSLAETVIPNSITTIESNCFSGCDSLSYVSIGSGMTSIGSRAFYNCPAMQSIYLPPSVKKIGEEAVGYRSNNDKSALIEDFTVSGKESSPAEDYAKANGLMFRTSDGAAQTHLFSSENLRIPLWALILLVGGGIGFFALSCIIAIRQHKSKQLRTEPTSWKKVTVDKN